MKEIESN